MSCRLIPGAQVIREPFAHHGPRAVQEYPLGGRGDLEQLADLVGAVVGDVAEADDGALTSGQLVEHAVDHLPDLPRERGTFGSRPRGGKLPPPTGVRIAGAAEPSRVDGGAVVLAGG